VWWGRNGRRVVWKLKVNWSINEVSKRKREEKNSEINERGGLDKDNIK
jgi:hypothetical protein